MSLGISLLVVHIECFVWCGKIKFSPVVVTEIRYSHIWVGGDGSMDIDDVDDDDCGGGAGGGGVSTSTWKHEINGTQVEN